jgi:hypothetical protein
MYSLPIQYLPLLKREATVNITGIAFKRACVFIIAILFAFSAQAQKTTLADYNIAWTSPGMNAQGSMPLGNGDIGINAWVEANGDLVFYLSKTDAWSENGQLLKLGQVRVSLSPNPFNGNTFLQELRLPTGEIIVRYGTADIRLWIDANHPVVQVEIDSKIPVQASISLWSWRKSHRPITGKESRVVWGIGESAYDPSCAGPLYQEPDTVITDEANRISWYHHNTYSIWKTNLELEALGDYVKTGTDPLLNRTFGATIMGEGLINKSDTLLVSSVAKKSIQVSIFPLTQISSSDSWKTSLIKASENIGKIPLKSRQAEHYKWWKEFWERSYIYITTRDTAGRKVAETVTQGYILQRFMNACGGRGNSPIKFNGSIFTVDTYNRNDEFGGMDADYRQWGGCYWWQNTRLPYWTMLVSGDFDLMKPLFAMYFTSLPLRKMATEKYYGHAGAFYPETMNFWGTHANGDYGCNRTGMANGFTFNPYIRYYWQGGLEMSLIMLDYYSFTRNRFFAKDTLVPFVSEILTFFDQHWKRGADGKIFFSPAMSLETWHTAENPLPEIVGIKAVASKMLALPAGMITDIQRSQWIKLIRDLPEIPLRTVNNETVLAPAAVFSNKANVENPELYAIFPYRTYGVGKPDIDLAKRTFAIRIHKENGGWQQNSIQAALLGFSDDARQMVIQSFSTWDKHFRFPAFWGPNYDWSPDQDHGNVAMIALQRMLVQYDIDTFTLLPAWPAGWNVRFRVNMPGNVIREGVYEDGKLKN